MLFYITEKVIFHQIKTFLSGHVTHKEVTISDNTSLKVLVDEQKNRSYSHTGEVNASIGVVVVGNRVVAFFRFHGQSGEKHIVLKIEFLTSLITFLKSHLQQFV